MRTIIKTVFMVALLTSISCAAAQEPVENVSRTRHGNLAAAQDLSRQAFDRLTAAQRANEFDLGGHAAKAKALLQQVNQEIKLAAQAANRNQ